MDWIGGIGVIGKGIGMKLVDLDVGGVVIWMVVERGWIVDADVGGITALMVFGSEVFEEMVHFLLEVDDFLKMIGIWQLNGADLFLGLILDAIL